MDAVADPQTGRQRFRFSNLTLHHPTGIENPRVSEVPTVKVAPYHSISLEDQQRQRYVHHDHDDCEDGKRIRSYNKRQGTGGFPRCDVCIKLG